MMKKPSDPAGDVALTTPPSQKVHNILGVSASFFHMRKGEHSFKLIYLISTEIIRRDNSTN